MYGQEVNKFEKVWSLGGAKFEQVCGGHMGTP